MLTLTDLLAIEEDLQVLEFAFEHDDFLMWPLIRAYVLLEALYAEYGLKNAHAHSGHLSSIRSSCSDLYYPAEPLASASRTEIRVYATAEYPHKDRNLEHCGTQGHGEGCTEMVH